MTPHQCNVLIVEDDVDLREVLAVALTSDGFRAETVADGREALHVLRSRADTCIILLDPGLPRLDGAHFRQAQLRDRSLGWIPVVVLSGDPDGRHLAESLGAKAFVPKPANLDQLREVLRTIRCRRGSREEERRTTKQ